MIMVLPPSLAIQLYNSVRSTNNQSSFSRISLKDPPFCRICRLGYSSRLKLMSIPCRCTGSIGSIHEECLKYWIAVRGINLCEICKQAFFVSDKSSFELFCIRFSRFFRLKYAGAIGCAMFNQWTIWRLIISHLKLFNDYSSDIYWCEMSAKKIGLRALAFITTVAFLSSSTVWLLDSMLDLEAVVNVWWNDVGDFDDSDYDDPDFEDFFGIISSTSSSFSLLEPEFLN